ncbi:MAG: HEAT repeat domain-containing protein [Candidatus Cloacimonetes bacterium]|nr:HEAT repeat domain-containing protein [Candidatus Cloacimonadota bacterium]
MKISMLVIAVMILLIHFGLQAEVSPEVTQNDVPHSYSPLNETDIMQIKELLAEAKLLPQSLNFEKDWDLSTREKSAWHMNALQKPLTGIEQVGALRAVCADSSDAGLAVSMNHFANIAWGTDDAIEVYAEAYFAYLSIFNATVKKPKDLFTFWNKVLGGLDIEIAAAYADIPKASLDTLTAFFFNTFAESEDKEKYAKLLTQRALPSPDNLETEALADMFKGINHGFLYLSALKYYAATQVMKKGAAKLLYTNRKPLIKLTKHGVMIIGTVVADTYDQYEITALAKNHLCLLIDPAGNDIYEMNLNTGKDNYTYLLIDYSGDDVYRSKAPADMFFSLLGHGVSYDIKGDDLYQNDDFAFSSFIGTNLHVDYAGNDIYHSGIFSQGAAMQGIAMLVDVEGNDTYSATTMAQGLGSVSGVGALLDYSGADVYQLGGKYFHAPLMPDDYRSMGQGMGFGMRPDFAGGLGLLYDKNGNDKYLGGVYAQGVGYWYATGVLIDEDGNDVYNAIYYPQGSGIHLACGFLYDGGGNDAYYSRHGPGEGAGHDWGFGALIDASGNDAYSIQGGNGLGLSNSVGIFVDKQGDDRYERGEPQNYGNGAFARSTGSIGLFLDMGGKDVYPDSTKTNDSTWQKGTYGIGRDIEIYSATAPAEEVQAGDAPLVAADAPIAEVFNAASEWEVGSAIKRVREARKVLAARSEEALPYILDNKLGTNSGLEYRALETFLTDVPAFHARLFDFVDDADSLKAKTSMSLIAGVKDSTLIVPIRKHLENKRYITACISLLGSINSEESVQILSSYAFHTSERYRYIAARSLREIGSKSAYSMLRSMNQDESFLVQALIRNLPEEKP